MPTLENRWMRQLAAAILALMTLGICGCGKKEPRLVDYLDQLEFDVPLETATYVPLGRFDIPIVVDKSPYGEAESHADPYVSQHHDYIWMRVQFELTAETTPRWKDAVISAAERHQGALSDAVLTAVRASRVSELADPRLLSVNARLTDVLRPMLGEERVRRLMFTKLDQAAMEAASKKKGGHGEDHEDVEHGEHDSEHGDTAHGRTDNRHGH